MVSSTECLPLHVWAGLLACGPAAVAEPQIAAARVEQTVVGRTGLRVGLNSTSPERVRERGDDVRDAEQLAPGALEGVGGGVRRVPLGDDVVVGHVGRVNPGGMKFGVAGLPIARSACTV